MFLLRIRPKLMAVPTLDRALAMDAALSPGAFAHGHPPWDGCRGAIGRMAKRDTEKHDKK
jgi:hypothetical protein